MVGVDATEPTTYSDYAAALTRPSSSTRTGLRLEVVAERRLRRLVREHWDELRSSKIRCKGRDSSNLRARAGAVNLVGIKQRECSC